MFWTRLALSMLKITPTMPNSKVTNHGNVKRSINYSYQKAYDKLYGIEEKQTFSYELEEVDDYAF